MPKPRFTTEQLNLATVLERELARLSCLCTRHNPIPTMEPFWVLGMDPTNNITEIENRTAELLALYSEATVKRFGLHRQPGNWLKKVRLLYNQVAEAWLALEKIQAIGQLAQYALARGAPDRTARKQTPPPLPRETRSTTPTTGKTKPLPN